MNPKLSVIVPVYNVEKYLSKCLDSILTQTFEDFEVICINSESPDNSMEVLSDYAQEDRRIKIICQKDEGPGAARNLGLTHVKGDFVSFVDGDDWIEPNTYELTLKKMTDDVDIVHFGANVVAGDVCDEDLESIEEAKRNHKIQYEGLFKTNDLLILNSTKPLWNKIYRTSLIKKHNITFPSGFACEDMIFYYKYALICKNAYYLGEYLYNYLRRKDSRTSQGYNLELPSFGDRTHTCDNLYEYMLRENLIENHFGFLEITFESFFKSDYEQCRIEDRNKLLETATELANKVGANKTLNEHSFVFKLKNKLYDKINL